MQGLQLIIKTFELFIAYIRSNMFTPGVLLQPASLQPNVASNSEQNYNQIHWSKKIPWEIMKFLSWDIKTGTKRSRWSHRIHSINVSKSSSATLQLKLTLFSTRKQPSNNNILNKNLTLDSNVDNHRELKSTQPCQIKPEDSKQARDTQGQPNHTQ